MKNILIILFCLSAVVVNAQTKSDVVDTKKHRIVMQFTEGDSLSQAAVTAQVKNVRTALPNAEIEVVCQGPGLDLLMKTKSKASKAVTDWAAQGVIFSACNNTMRRRNVKPEELLSSAQVVPSAIVELTLKQEAGWAYVKGGH